MHHTNMLLAIAVVFSLGNLTVGQGITLKLSGDSNLGFNLNSLEGVPLVLTTVPGWMPTAPENLVSRTRVADDLQLVPWQSEELKKVIGKVRDTHQKKRQEFVEAMKAESDPKKREKLQRLLSKNDEELKSELQDSVEDILLPFQRERLAQIVTQVKLNNNGSSALEGDEFAKALKLTDQQLKQLKKKQQAMQSQLQEEIKELRRKRQREVIESVLTKGQQASLKKLIGDELPAGKNKSKKQP